MLLMVLFDSSVPELCVMIREFTAIMANRINKVITIRM